MKKHTLTIDFMRGMASQLVLLAHGYALFFSLDKDATAPFYVHFWYKLVSFPSNFGHAAVMIFFVISGYLVGHDVFIRMSNNTFSPKFYTISRLSRLYCVVLPGLLVCAGLDYVSFQYGQGHIILAGSVPFYPEWWLNANTFRAKTFACNLVFLQMAECQQYGTNASLWSLSNELFYYALFPSILLILQANAIRTRFVAGLVFGLFLVEVLKSPSVTDPDRALIYLQGLIIWCMGAFLPQLFNFLPYWFSKSWAVLVFIVTTIALRKVEADSFTQDIFVSILIMQAIYHTDKLDSILIKCPKGCMYLINQFSNYSFSLYFMHLPVMFALRSFVPTFQGRLFFCGYDVLKYGGVIIIVNLIAFGFYWLFERHYLRLRNFLMRAT